MLDPETLTTDPVISSKKRRKFRRWIVLALFITGLFWLNGPGLRWLVPKVASHFFETVGMSGSFRMEGSLTSGLSITDLQLTGDRDLASLSVNKLELSYQFKKLIRGEIDGLAIDGLHADLRLGLDKDEVKKPAPSLEKLAEISLDIRRKILPISIDLKNISLTASRDGQPVFSLAPSQISHPSGSDVITLELGAVTDATGKVWPAQKSVVLWNESAISIARLDPYPGISVRDFFLQLPTSSAPSLATQIHFDDTVFVITSGPGFSSAQINLRDGRLEIDEIAKRFGLEIPARAVITSFALDVNGIFPDPKAATGTAKIQLEDLAWQEWKAAEINIDATLLAEKISLAGKIKALATELSLNAEAPITRAADQFLLGNTKGDFSIASIPNLLAELAKRSPIIDPLAPVPPSSLEGNFNLSLANNLPQSADANFIINPSDAKLVSSISLNGRWQKDQPITVEAALDGLRGTAIYQISPAIYQSTFDFDDFTNSRIDRWLAVGRVKPGGVANLSGKWSGSGEIKTGRHRGDLAFTQATWTRESMAPITAIGGITYDWPGSFETKSLRLQSKEQAVAIDAALSGGLLVVKNFLWTDGQAEMAEGSASLPVPQDFAKWQEMLATDTRPLAVSLTSRKLSLGLLKQWLPSSEAIDPRSSGQLQLQVSGTYAAPVVDAKLDVKDLRSPTKPNLPPADLAIELAAADGKMVVNATVTAPDFPAALMKANLPFRPADWARNPNLLADEPIDARLDLPRLDLSRFITLMPGVQQLNGVITGNAVAFGKVSQPKLAGEIKLNGGGFRLKDERIPKIENVSAVVVLALDKITLKSLKTVVAGGSLTGEGSLAINSGKFGDLDFKLRGSYLPIMRNELLILRTNMDLRLQGPWEKVAISGTVRAVDSIFYRDIELLPIGTPFNTPSAAAIPKIDPPKNQGASIPEPFRNWSLNVMARTQDPFLIRGNLATGEVNGSIRVDGTLGNPLPDGSLKITDFQARLPFSTLSVRSGTVSFNPASGFDPILEIKGTAEPRPYEVTVYAYGRLSNPQLVLTSNPPLPDNEIMTLLATGTTTSGLENSQAASSRALQLLAEELRRGRFGVGKQLRPVLALLDKVDFSLAEADPYSSESFSTATLSITDRWLLSAGMGAEGDSRVLAIWRVSFR